MTELRDDLYQQILEHGLREFPNECCGVVAARDDVPQKVFAMRNADTSPVTYRLDGREQLRVFREMEEGGLDLWAIFHSHTHSQAYPSETDINQAFYPEARYILLSLEDRENPVIRSFFIEGGQVAEEELKIA